MPKFILLIESATDTCSAALSDEEKLLAQKVCRIGKSHDTILAPLAESILSENGVKAKDLAAVAVSEGPGSYMGLRIGVSLAKGIAYAAGTKLIGISTLEVISQSTLDEKENVFTHIVPMIDAGRMEVYTAVYDHSLKQITPTEAKILDGGSFKSIIAESNVLFCGNGAPKFGRLLSETFGTIPENVTILDQAPMASGLRIAASKALDEGKVSDLAYFQPFYLKEFIPGKQKKLL